MDNLTAGLSGDDLAALRAQVAQSIGSQPAPAVAAAPAAGPMIQAQVDPHTGLDPNDLASLKAQIMQATQDYNKTQGGQAASLQAPAATPGHNIYQDMGTLHRFGIGAWQGMQDIGNGLTQLGLRGAKALGMNVDNAIQDSDAMAKDNAADEARLSKAGIAGSVGQFTGNAALTTPLMFVPGLNAVEGAGALANTARLAAGGAAAGALQPLTGNIDNFAQQKALQAAGGAALGAILPPVAQVAGKMLRPAIAPVMEKAGLLQNPAVAQDAANVAAGQPTALTAFDPAGTPTQGLHQALANMGTSWNQLPNEMQAALAAKSPQMSQMGIDLPAQIRAARFASLPEPVEGTVGQITRNPDQVVFEQETSKLNGLGMPLQTKFAGQNQQMVNNLDALIDQTGGQAKSPYDLKSVANALNSKLGDMKQGVSDAYAAARANPTIANAIDASPVKSYFDDNFNMLGILPELRGAQSEFQRLSKPLIQLSGGADQGKLSIDALESLRQFASKATNQADPRSKQFMGGLKGAIDDAVLNSGNSDVFAQARFLRGLQASEFQNQGLLNKLTKMATPTDRAVPYDKIYSNVMGDDVQSIQQLKNSLLTAGPNGEQAWADLVGMTARNLKDAALNNATDINGQNVFNAIALERSLDRIGQDKLNLVLGPQLTKKFYSLATAGKDLKPPVGAAVNTSNTASALANLGSQFKNALGAGIGFIPGGKYILAGKAILGDQVQAMKTAKRVQQSINPTVGLILQHQLGVNGAYHAGLQKVFQQNALPGLLSGQIGGGLLSH